MTRFRFPRPSLALVVAFLALAVALGGTSYAAVSLAKNSVMSKHIKNGQVKRADLKNNAVNSAKVKDGSLSASDFTVGQLPTGATGPAGPKGDAGAQGIPGPVNTVTVVAPSVLIASNGIGSATAECPTGMQAIGGGPDMLNNGSMVMTASFPLVDNTNVIDLPVGQNPAATAWRAVAKNNGLAPAGFKVAVVCAG